MESTVNKRLVSLICSAVLLFSLAACSKDTQGDEQTYTSSNNTEASAYNNISVVDLSTDSGEYHFRAERLNLPEDIGIMSAFALRDDILYVCCHQGSVGAEITAIYSFDMEGNILTKFDYDRPLSENGIHKIDVDLNFSLWALESSSEYIYDDAGGIIGSDASYSLIRFNPDGSAGQSIVLDNNLQPVDLNIFGEYIHIICFDRLIVLDTSGNRLFEIDLSQFITTTVTDNGLVSSSHNPNGFELSVLNYDMKRFDSIANFNIQGGLIYGFGDRVLISNGAGLHSYDLETLQGTSLSVNWINLGLSGNYNKLFGLSDGGIVYCEPYKVYILRAYEGVVGGDGSGTLILATLDESLVKWQVLDFNEANGRYKIEVVDYSVYNTNEDSTEGLMKLATEITAGNVPDIIDLSSLPRDMYDNNSLLENIMPFIENDADYGISDFEESALKAMMTGEKLYNFTPLFYIMAVLGNRTDVEGRSIDSFSDLTAIAQGSSVFGQTISRSQMVMYALGASNSKFIDYDTGVCRFDSAEFVDFLEFVKTLPETEDYFNSDNDIASGNQWFSCNPPIGNVGFIINQRLAFGGDICFAGLPFTNNNETILVPYQSYGMAAASQQKEGVWEFFKFLLSDEFLDNQSSTFVTIKTSANEYEAQQFRDWIARDGKWSYYVGYQETQARIENENDLDLLRELIKCDAGMFRHNEALYNIVMEDASDFFAGTTTAEDAARVIQSRASIYMSERR